MVGETGGGGRYLDDATGPLELAGGERIEQDVVVAGRHGYDVGVRHERGRQDPHLLGRAVGRADLMDHRFSEARTHETRQVSVLAHHHVTTSKAPTTKLVQYTRVLKSAAS